MVDLLCLTLASTSHFCCSLTLMLSSPVPHFLTFLPHATNHHLCASLVPFLTLPHSCGVLGSLCLHPIEMLVLALSSSWGPAEPSHLSMLTSLTLASPFTPAEWSAQGVMEFLEEKRSNFPRFYFLSNNEMVNVLVR